MRNIQLILIALFLSSAASIQAQDAHQEYIQIYKDIAIEEMHRTGIPASIKLAQGILESNAGRSHLARKGNNHFGIKCGNNWKGGSVLRKDDDYRNGRLIKSCFRKYDNAQESFIAHSEFLRDPKKNHRYGFLFQYEPTDYKSWAYGLKKAGYATNRKYPKLLIQLIERYDLSKFDRIPDQDAPPLAMEEGYVPQVQLVNDVEYVYAMEDETPEKISLDFQVSVDRIIKYNERIKHPHQNLEKGARVFLQRKRSAFRGKRKFHYVKKGESMFDIAQKYGMRLDKLLKKNHMEEGQQAAVGAKLRLRGLHWFDERPVLRSEQKSILPDQPEEQLPPDEEIEALPHAEKEVDGAEVKEIEEISQQSVDESQKKRYYTVERGDTLYSISQHFNLELNQLKEWNKLDSANINVGQTLRVH
jgi:LysM repeat protein